MVIVVVPVQVNADFRRIGASPSQAVQLIQQGGFKAFFSSFCKAILPTWASIVGELVFVSKIGFFFVIVSTVPNPAVGNHEKHNIPPLMMAVGLVDEALTIQHVRLGGYNKIQNQRRARLNFNCNPQTNPVPEDH
jgi:hypothetical protein